MHDSSFEPCIMSCEEISLIQLKKCKQEYLVLFVQIVFGILSINIVVQKQN